MSNSIDSPTPGLPDDNELIDGAEASRILNVKEKTLPVWRSTKRYPALKYAKIGSLVKYRRGDVRAFIASRMVG